MSNSFFMPFRCFVIIIIIFVILICFLFIPTLNFANSNFSNNGFSILIDNSEYVWPVPGYMHITSYFGKRNSPTAGASSYHYGIDIGAPQGANLIAVTSGQITFTGFLGSGGYTITLTSGSMKFTYCHVSPNYIVKEGDFVLKGQIIRICRTKKCLWCKRQSLYRQSGQSHKWCHNRSTLTFWCTCR